MRAVIFTAGALLGFALGTAIVVSRADSLGGPDPDTIAVAAELGLDATDVQGALNTLHDAGHVDLDARTYLCWVGEGPCPKPTTPRAYAYAEHPDVAWCIDRIVAVESPGWFANGWNPTPVGRAKEHASGLGGFLPSTWASTPQGQAGASIWNPWSQVDAIAWMLTHDGLGRPTDLAHSRGGEFAAVAWGRCGR